MKLKLNDVLGKAYEDKQVLKTIIGIDNFNILNSLQKIRAAEVGGSTYIDLAANVDLLLAVRSLVSLPLCVSSICIQELHDCYDAGANILEIGNFDVFYRKNIYLTGQQIFNTSKELRLRCPNALVSVTIPHTLTFSNQLSLAKSLQDLGVDMIQTEGFSSKLINTSNMANALKYASAALCSTLTFADALSIPVISSSGITPLTAPMAISFGACGVGIGSFFNTCQSSLDLSKQISEIIYSLKTESGTSKCMYNASIKKDYINILSKV
uniref:Uncharacterized protein ycf23 n=1 Tax=Trichogloeopsis pedicellata TaxID=1495610 RepID=A0A1G4P0D7_9FLOR|nr:Hypothetical protein ycf23 [Trichogloeopsis pedicellata]SCW24364.1 Hypothetical protein ycf23 [Trichogloeopsis pedicellata]